MDYVTNKVGQKRPYGFKYSPQTGMFYRSRIGSVKNTVGKLGPIYNKKHSYLYFCVIENKKLKVWKLHRLAFIFMNVFIKEKDRKTIVDHINGNAHDNRWCNLRLVDKRENDQNKKSHRNGKLVGAIQDKRYESYFKSQIRINNKRYYLGMYKTEKDAHEAYMRALENWNNEGILPE